MAGAGSKNCGLTAKIAGTVKLVALLPATVLLMRGPLKTAPETAYAPRVELAPEYTQRPFASVLPPTVGSPGVALVSTPAARFAGRAAGVKPKPTSVSFRLKLEFPVSVTAPPEVNSTKFETVAVIVTEPVVCANAAVALIKSKAVIARVVVRMPFDLNMCRLLLYGWGIVGSSRFSKETEERG